MKRILILLFLSTLSFSNLYQRFDNRDSYLQAINENENIDANERLFGIYFNADLLKESELIDEEEKIIEKNPDIKLFMDSLPKNGKLYNIEVVMKTFRDIPFILEMYIEKGYMSQLKSKFKKTKNKYIYYRLNDRYDEIEKYNMSRALKYRILDNMTVGHLKMIYKEPKKYMPEFLNFVDKNLGYYNIQDKKYLYSIIVQIEYSTAMLSKVDKKYRAICIKADKVVSKLIKEKEIKMLDEDNGMSNVEFLRTWR